MPSDMGIIVCYCKMVQKSQKTTWDVKKIVNGMNYQPQVVKQPDFWTINSKNPY